jgi:hypothetical protein
MQSAILVTLVVVTLASGALTVWSFARVIKHRLAEFRAGAAVYARLRPTKTAGGVLRGMLTEPLLPLSKEAAHLPQTGEMMSSYWKSGLYGLLAMSSGMVFVVAAALVVS